MSLLRKVNVFIAILGVCAGIYHFFIGNMDLPGSLLFSFLSIMYLLPGIEGIITKEVKDNKPYYVYLFVGLCFSSIFILELVKIF
ncbi:hypothetical protein HP456_20965 [Bacillus haikouensis]|uniref:hypothetical protein n=1 Tax=Bacillus haikouensis TaxID=1510468 RepID=UPI0015526EC9|nr:hypothetical protein [Bacillus haikouensis]NQD68384.1 hypothetical protein [Bacillus haikouensis]